MKNTLLLLFAFLSFLFAGTINAQDASFPTDSARWCYRLTGDFGQYLGSKCFSPLGYDSIGGKQYARIEYMTFPQQGRNEEIHYRVDGDKVYVLPQDSLQEILVYDFSLAVGDTFEVNWSLGFNGIPFKVVVINIRSVIGSDSIARRIFTLVGNSSFQQTEWIEGIGSYWMHLLPNYEGSLSGSISFLCFDNTKQGGYFSCGTVSIEPEIANLKVYPNPARDHFYLENPTATQQSIKVLDLNGKLLLQQQLTAGNNRIMLPSGTPTGIYAVWMANLNGEFAVRKLVVE